MPQECVSGLTFPRKSLFKWEHVKSQVYIWYSGWPETHKTDWVPLTSTQTQDRSLCTAECNFFLAIYFTSFQKVLYLASGKIKFVWTTAAFKIWQNHFLPMLFSEWHCSVTHVHSTIKVLDECLQSHNLKTSYFSSISQQMLSLL